MSVATRATDWTEARESPRDEVHFRAKAVREDGDELLLLIVNMSAGGLMARCGASFAIGERIAITLPALGPVQAETRWCLGGRAGFQFDPALPLADYLTLLASVVRD